MGKRLYFYHGCDKVKGRAFDPFFIPSRFTSCVFVHRVYATYEDLAADFVSGTLHPGDLKASLTAAINE